MAKPAFIYAFDNLGPYRFVELCAELLGARYKGFILGGVGPDGGIDAEIDNVLGEWYPETEDSLLSPTTESGQVVKSGQTVIFQFKHKVTARVGQANARSQMLGMFRGKDSEVNKPLVKKKKPDAYVLITNIEVNSQFRDSFQSECKKVNPDISHYQVMGLDELENWVTQEKNIRHLYFPTIFDLPRYNLELSIDEGFYAPIRGSWLDAREEDSVALLQVTIYNVGIMPSYVSHISFGVIDNGKLQYAQLLRLAPDRAMDALNPPKGEPLEPGRKQTYNFRFAELRHLFSDKFLAEIVVIDEIQNRYSIAVPENFRQRVNET